MDTPNKSLIAASAAAWALCFYSPASAGTVVFSEDFESGTAGTTIVADNVITSTSILPGDPGAIAQYSSVAAAPGGGSQSMLLQDSSLAGNANAPEVFWDLNGGNPLDTTKTVKVSYWHRVSSNTVVGQPTHNQPSTQGRIQHIVLTASDAQKTRPEGSQNYLAQAWNWTNGPASPGSTFDYEAAFDAGDARGFYGEGLALDTWYRVDNYIPLVDQKDGTPSFLGEFDEGTQAFLGYNNPLGGGPNTFYSRSLNSDLTAVAGQTPYGARRGSTQTDVGGGSGGEFLIRALQVFGGGADFMTQFYDDITVEYVTTGDITTVMEAITGGSTDAEYDYNGSGIVDEADRNYFVQNALQTAYGDTNYDFMVDSTDLSNIAANFDTATSGWENGDFNGDGSVDAADIAMVEPFWLNAFQPMTPAGDPDFQQALLDAGIIINAGIDGDYSGDGSVDQGDLDLVLLNWGDDASVTGVPAGWVNQQPTGLIGQTELDGVLLNWGDTAEANGGSVPEPGTLGLLGGLAVLVRRRRTA